MQCKFIRFKSKLNEWHENKVDPNGINPNPKPNSKIGLSFIILFVLLAVFLNVNVRVDQKNAWISSANNIGFESTLSFSTADAPYFLGLGTSIHEKGSTTPFQQLRLFPNNSPEFNTQWTEKSTKDGTLLPQILSTLATGPNISQVLDAGHSLTFLSAVLTTLMIVFAFGAAGYWGEGAIASIGGGLSIAYLMRSSFGRIDTDQLNLGFLYLIFGLALTASKATKP